MPDMLRILCVDDDEDALFVTLLSLQLDDYIAASSARGAAIGLDLLRDTDRNFDCLLLDVRMPGMSGTDMLRNVRALPKYAETPVIFLTASVLDSDLADYRQIGALGLIAKPYNPLTIAADVRRLMGSHLARAIPGDDRVTADRS